MSHFQAISKPLNVALWSGRLARERQVNVRAVLTGKAIEESVDVAYEIFNRVFRRLPERMPDDRG